MIVVVVTFVIDTIDCTTLQLAVGQTPPMEHLVRCMPASLVMLWTPARASIKSSSKEIARSAISQQAP
jgi:hypothetical protein